MIFTSFFWKQKAREALKGHWLTALLIALVVNLPSMLVQGIAAYTGNDLLTRLQTVVSESVTGLTRETAALDAEKLLAGMTELRGDSGIWIMQGLNLAAWLLTPCLTLGMVHWMLTRLRKQASGDVTSVFSRMGLFLKGIGLRIYVAFRVFLWTLPGIALNVAAVLPLLLGGRESSIAALQAANTSVGIQSAAMVVTAVLGILAALKYALSDMVLADDPALGPVKAAAESRRLTAGKRGPLFSLYISFLLWYLLAVMAANAAAGMMGPVPGLMVQMLASLALTVYLNTSVCAFYLGCRKTEAAAAEDAEPAEEETEEESGILP